MKLIVKQVQNNEEEEEEEICLQPVNMSFPVMKELSAKRLVGMFDYIRENPNLVVNGFVHAGISTAFDVYIDSSTLSLFYSCFITSLVLFLLNVQSVSIPTLTVQFYFSDNEAEC